MGLAASQCRLLFLTSRQNDIQKGMQDTTMRRLALTRATQKITREHNRALDSAVYKTSWQANGNLDVDTMSLNYSKFMTPTGGLGQQFLLTDTSGRVILSDDYCTKLGIAAGTNSGAGSAITKTQSEFLQAIMSINASTANAYIENFNPANDSTTNTSMSVLELLSNEFIDAANSTKQATSASWNLDTLVSSNLSWAEIYNRNLDVLISDRDNQNNALNFKKLLDDFYGDICSRLNINNNSSVALKYAYDQTFRMFSRNQQSVG
ncbi:MAG TPA: hypothetical protein PKI94_07100, partial [Candidatus Gastranaerophilaceae bacterium]|nr:hypothetical protein [Candidatus Gastranaerophilaceae bacterium]